jgi:hypothetical protein
VAEKIEMTKAPTKAPAKAPAKAPVENENSDGFNFPLYCEKIEMYIYVKGIDRKPKNRRKKDEKKCECKEACVERRREGKKDSGKDSKRGSCVGCLQIGESSAGNSGRVTLPSCA